MKNKNILYLTYDGLCDPLGQSQILPYLASLSKLNYNFTVISVEKKINLNANFKNISKFCKENHIRWFYILYTKKPIILSTIYDLFIFNNLLKNVLKKNKYQIIHCRSYLTSIFGIKISKKFNIPFVFDMRGFWPDEKVEAKSWNLTNPFFYLIYIYFKNLETKLILMSDKIVVLTDSAKKIILQKYNIKFDKIEVIPCSVDLNIFNKDNINVSLLNNFKKLYLNNENDKYFILTYLGSLGTWYMLDEMLLFFHELKKYNMNSKFLILTNDLNYENLLNDKDIIFINAKRVDIPSYLSITNTSIFFIKPTLSKKGSSPTKLAEIISMGTQFVTNYGIGDIELLNNNYNLGIMVNSFNKEEYFNIIPSLFQEHNKTHYIQTANVLFSLNNATLKYNKIYEDL